VIYPFELTSSIKEKHLWAVALGTMDAAKITNCGRTWFLSYGMKRLMLERLKSTISGTFIA